MKSSIKNLLLQIKRQAVRRAHRVESCVLGRKRLFRAYDRGDDTFVFEWGVWTDLDEHASVLIVEKSDLGSSSRGHVFTVSTGNHSVAALPLLSGRFWDLASVPPDRKSAVMTQAVLCGNVVGGKLELSQRDVDCARLVRLDAWLTETLAFPMGDVVLLERNGETLEHYRRLGQEWRVKPLAWTPQEMQVALAASRKRISTPLKYYHAAKGVHFLSYTDFHAFVLEASTDFAAFLAKLREMVAVFEGNETSFVRQPKYHGHHEIEFFGLSRGVALERLVPALEDVLARHDDGRMDRVGVAARMAVIDRRYKALLTRPDLADDTSEAFVATLYMYLTGEIYAVMGEGATPAFDDRRTALPGATFAAGTPAFHPLADVRTKILIANIRTLVSKDEFVEYANVYELRNEPVDGRNAENRPIGQGSTREIVYKTNRSPIVRSLVEKRLSRSGTAYGSYVFARIGAFKALGIELAEYRLLRRRHAGERGAFDYFIRTRCEGDPLRFIPATHFQRTGSASGEDPQVVGALAFFMGDAAAQNLTMKKFDPRSQTCLYDIGKEIYRFDYDFKAGRLMPRGVSCCSVRGSFGWPDTTCDEANFRRFNAFYATSYAHALKRFHATHPVVPLAELVRAFLDGFERRCRALAWQVTVRRDQFEEFNPHLPGRYGFPVKWRFVLWAIARQAERLDAFTTRFRAALNPKAGKGKQVSART